MGRAEGSGRAAPPQLPGQRRGGRRGKEERPAANGRRGACAVWGWRCGAGPTEKRLAAERKRRLRRRAGTGPPSLPTSPCPVPGLSRCGLLGLVNPPGPGEESGAGPYGWGCPWWLPGGCAAWWAFPGRRGGGGEVVVQHGRPAAVAVLKEVRNWCPWVREVMGKYRSDGGCDHEELPFLCFFSPQCFLSCGAILIPQSDQTSLRNSADLGHAL